MKLILCGFGSGDQNTLANQKLNEIIDHNKPILYIPLAMGENEHPYDGCYEWINEELKSVDKTGISMVRSFEDLASRNLQDYSALFIGGGNTYKLLLGLKESGAFKNIRDYINNDGVVIGGSAGAVIFGYDINNIRIFIGGFVSIMLMLWSSSYVYYYIRRSKNILWFSNIGTMLFIQMLESIIFVIISYIGEFDFTLLFGMIVIRYLIKIMIGMIGLIPVYTIVKMKDK